MGDGGGKGGAPVVLDAVIIRDVRLFDRQQDVVSTSRMRTKGGFLRRTFFIVTTVVLLTTFGTLSLHGRALQQKDMSHVR